MTQVDVDPKEVRQFASGLKRFDAQLQSDMGRLQAQLHRLGETWRDQEHARFAQDFEQTMRILQRFIQSADEYIPFLLRKAEAAEEFLRRR